MTNSQQHPIEYLFEKLKAIGTYPEGVVSMRERIPGIAFFPGGNGLWNPNRDLPPMPVGKIMVLGHNFDSEKGYEASVARGEENVKGGTWRNLIELFGSVSISLADCFFTNAFMGIKQGNVATGKFPGADSPPFVETCQRFLVEQIEIQRPKLIITLGSHVPAFIALLLSEELTAWLNCKTVTELDAQSCQLLSPVHFIQISNYSTTIAALTHPSFRRLNVKHRKYNGFVGNEAELALLKDAVVTSGLQGS